MVVSIWNNGYSENSKDFTAIVAAFIVIGVGESVTLLENETRGELIGHSILGKKFDDALCEVRSAIPLIGAGGSLGKSLANRLNMKYKGENVISIINDGLYYIPQFDDHPMPIFDEYIVDKTYRYIDRGEDISDFVLFDTAKRSNMSTPYILEASSKIIVIMPTNFFAFYKFFDVYRSISARCLFVLIEDKIPKKFIRELKERYGLTTKNLFVFRRTEEFIMYRHAGRLVDYIRNYVNVEKDSKEYKFMRELRKLYVAIKGSKPKKQR